MSMAFMAGMAMTTLGLLGFLALTLVLMGVAIAYARQQVQLAMVQSEDGLFETGARPVEAPPGSATARRAA